MGVVDGSNGAFGVILSFVTVPRMRAIIPRGVITIHEGTERSGEERETEWMKQRVYSTPGFITVPGESPGSTFG